MINSVLGALAMINSPKPGLTRGGHEKMIIVERLGAELISGSPDDDQLATGPPRQPHAIP